jgi:hypothetical protein
MYKEGSTKEDLQLSEIHQFSHNRKEIGLAIHENPVLYIFMPHH